MSEQKRYRINLDHEIQGIGGVLKIGDKPLTARDVILTAMVGTMKDNYIWPSVEDALNWGIITGQVSHPQHVIVEMTADQVQWLMSRLILGYIQPVPLIIVGLKQVMSLMEQEQTSAPTEPEGRFKANPALASGSWIPPVSESLRAPLLRLQSVEPPEDEATIQTPISIGHICFAPCTYDEEYDASYVQILLNYNVESKKYARTTQWLEIGGKIYRAFLLNWPRSELKNRASVIIKGDLRKVLKHDDEVLCYVPDIFGEEET